MLRLSAKDEVTVREQEVCPRFVTRLQLEHAQRLGLAWPEAAMAIGNPQRNLLLLSSRLIQLSCRQSMRMRGVKKVEN